MKYYFSNENLSALISTLSIVASDKDAKIVLNFGERKNVKEMIHVAMCLGGTEQENVKFLGEIPEGFENPEKFAFDARMFLTILQSCLTLRERTYIETADSICYVGVDGSARFPLPVISFDSIPDGIPMDPSKTLVQFAAKATDFLSALRAGAYAAAGGVDQFANPVLVLDTTSEKPQLNVYSSDGKTIARGRCECRIPDGGTEREERLNSWLAEKKLSAFTIALPKKVVSDILKLGATAEQLNVVVTDRHIFMSPNVATIYAASLGAQFTHLETYVNQWLAADKCTEVVADLSALKASLDLLLKYMDVAGTEKSPTLLSFNGKEISLAQLEGGEGTTCVKVVESSGDAVNVCFNGKKVMETINSLNKGNLKISFLSGDRVPVMFSNGSLEQDVLNGNVSFILPVKKKCEAVPVKEEPEADAGDSADENESEE